MEIHDRKVLLQKPLYYWSEEAKADLVEVPPWYHVRYVFVVSLSSRLELLQEQQDDVYHLKDSRKH